MFVADMAETYHVFNYRGLPVKTLAALAAGLRDESRVKRAERKLTMTEELLAIIADMGQYLVWMQSKDGAKGINRPDSILEKLLGDDGTVEKEFETFNNGEEFERRKKLIISKVNGEK